MTEAPQQSIRTAGRPRRPDIDQRVLRAAIELYIEHGVAGVNFFAVARRAQVAKDAVSLRWPSSHELLLAALESELELDLEFDSGELRADLIGFAVAAFHWQLSEAGAAYLRLQIDQRYDAKLRRAAWERLSRPVVQSARRIIERGIARGELPAGANVNLLLEAIAGAIAVRVLDTKLSDRPQLLQQAQSYLERVVDTVLAGATADHR